MQSKLCDLFYISDFSEFSVFLRFPVFRLFRFRSPLLTESLRFIFLWVLKCFTSPGTPPRSARKFRYVNISTFRYLRAKHGSPWFARRGFPIRSSSDQSPLDGSPKLIAVTPRPSSPLNVKASSIRPLVGVSTKIFSTAIFTFRLRLQKNFSTYVQYVSKFFFASLAI